MNKVTTVTLILLALPLSVARPQEPPAPRAGTADVVVLGPIITCDPARPRATGVVINDGIIVRVTDQATAEAAVGPHTRVIRVPASGAAMPGIIESHAHLLGVGRAARTLDLRGTRSADEVADRVRLACQTLPADAWVLGRGWNQEHWDDSSWPHRATLDAVTGGRPALLTRVDGHAVWVNSAALERARLTSTVGNPPGGEIIRDGSGQATGILVDNATDLVERVLPPETDPEEMPRDFLAAQQQALSLGITTFVDAGTTPEALARLNQLYATNQMKLRVYAMLGVASHEDLALLANRPPIKSLHGDRVAVRAWKLYADGALGSRGAWLLKPYNDRPGHVGLPVLDPSFIQTAASRALAQGYQVCVHAIGDRGIRETLDAIQRAMDRAQPAQRANHRFRIEHAQIVNPHDIPRFRKLGVFPSMQGCHCTSDGPWVPARIGPQRAAAGAYVWRSFLDAGLIIANGTDAPVESLSPWENLYSSVTRFMANDEGPKAFHPAQRMNRLEALYSLTAWGATAIFAENQRGRIRPGFQADIAVINRDPLRCSVWHLSRISVLQTILAGEVVYER